MKTRTRLLMMRWHIRPGDYVETEDGRVGYVKAVCGCEKCEQRGFFEPIVKYTDGTEEYITRYEAENDFKGYRRIGAFDLTASEPEVRNSWENSEIVRYVNERSKHLLDEILRLDSHD